jgi:DNA-binding transcriptional MerR regulator
VSLVSIGEFARLARLSPKALRRYDESGLLEPAHVDPGSGYRWYETAQLEQARLVAALRGIDVPLAEIKPMLGMPAAQVAELITAYWSRVEAAHGARRELAGNLVDRLTGKRSAMHEVTSYEVSTREVPQRSLLCLKRNVTETQALALGKEFVALLRSRPVQRLDGRAGATFAIYHGEVNEDSDGPVEWCLPVAADQAEALAARFPELTLRTEPAHEEAFVHLGDIVASPPQWQLAGDALYGWAGRQHRRPSALGVRITHLVSRPVSEDSVPDSDFALPLG